MRRRSRALDRRGRRRARRCRAPTRRARMPPPATAAAASSTSSRRRWACCAAPASEPLPEGFSLDLHRALVARGTRRAAPRRPLRAAIAIRPVTFAATAAALAAMLATGGTLRARASRATRTAPLAASYKVPESKLALVKIDFVAAEADRRRGLRDHAARRAALRLRRRASSPSAASDSRASWPPARTRSPSPCAVRAPAATRSSRTPSARRST